MRKNKANDNKTGNKGEITQILDPSRPLSRGKDVSENQLRPSKKGKMSETHNPPKRYQAAIRANKRGKCCW